MRSGGSLIPQVARAADRSKAAILGVVLTPLMRYLDFKVYPYCFCSGSF